MSKRKIIYLVSATSLLFALALLYFIGPFNKPQHYKIAFIGRFYDIKVTDEKNERNKDYQFIHTQSIKTYIKSFNDKTDGNLEFISFNNHGDKDSLKAIYENILQDTSIIAVIDNSWGSELAGAQKVIRTSNIPVVAINGDKNNLSYGSMLFTGSDDSQVTNIVQYLKRGLKSDTVNFIYEANYSSSEKYFKAFEENGITIQKQLIFESEELLKEQVDSAKLLALFANKHMTVINAHGYIGSYVINYANNNFTDETIVGIASIINSGEYFNLKGNNKLIVLGQSDNVIPKALAKDLLEFEKSYPEIYGFNKIRSIRKCRDAWSVIESAITESQTFRRAGISDRFNSYKSSSLEIGYDILAFDENGLLIHEIIFVQWDRKGEKPQSLQMNSDGQIIPNINLGIEIIDLQDINLSSNSFSTDFFYWITVDSAYKNIEEFITFENIKPSESETELVTEKNFGALTYKLYKVSGVFFENYNEINFPFDQQEISIDIQVLNTAEKLRVSFDKESFDQNISNFSLKGWNQNEFYVTVDNVVTNRLKGNLGLGDNQINKFKNISFRFNVARSILPGILQIILPLLFIGILAIALLYLKNLSFNTIGEPLAAVFLTVIAYSISLSEITPTGSVLTKTDYLFILTLFTVVASFIIGLLHNTSNPIKLRTVTRAKYGLALFYLLSFALISLLNFK